MKKTIAKKTYSSLTTVLVHSLLNVGLRVSEREAPEIYKKLLLNCGGEIINKKAKVMTFINSLNEVFAYCLVNNDSTDKSGEVTLICVGDNLHQIIFIINCMSVYLNIEGCGGTIRIILSDNKRIKTMKPEDYIDKCDLSFISSREPYCDGVYKGLIIPKHSKIWIIKTCGDYWDEKQLHHKLVDMRSYKDIIEYSLLKENKLDFIRSETIEPFIKSRSYLYDKNTQGRWSTDYLCGDRYGYDKIYFVLPMTEKDFSNHDLINGVKLLFKNDLDRDLFKSRFGFYIMNPENNIIEDSPYERSYDSDANYSVRDYTDNVLDIIYK